MNLKRYHGLRSSVSLPTIQVQAFETGRFQMLEAVYLDVSTYTDISTHTDSSTCAESSAYAESSTGTPLTAAFPES